MSRATKAQPPRSAFDELIATEQEIAAGAAAAEREAEALLAVARLGAASGARESAQALERELTRLDERARSVRETLVRTIEAEAARNIARYRSLSDAEVAGLAAEAAAEVTGLAPERAP